MFCGNCGAQNADNVAFCKNCGQQLGNAAQPQEQVQQPYGEPVQPKKPLNKKLIGIIAGGAAAVILVVVLLGGGTGAGSPEAVAEKYVKAVGKIDTDGVLALVPEETLDYVAEDAGYDDIDEMREDMEASEDVSKEALDQMNMKISGEAVDTEELDDDELEYLQEFYDEEFDLKVTAAAEVEVEMTISASYMGESIEESDTMYINVVEIDGTWYLDVYNFDISGFDIF